MIVGVTTTNNANQLQLLLEDGETLYIEADMWQPFDKELEKAMVCVNIKRKGKNVSEIEKCQCKQLKKTVCGVENVKSLTVSNIWCLYGRKW